MKFLGVAVLVVGLIFGAAYLGGALDFSAEVKVSDKMKQDVVELSDKTIEKTKNKTTETLDNLKQKIKEEVE